ncbi:MAG TPA: PepSY-associated TM helix domain-containing protein [Puia sp.]|nr:PepSY-associated TM helix domain-containing protein [Puia sp.]
METNRLKRKTAMLVRWLHIYLSMISFAVVFFFAVTGLTLNHAEKFGDEARTRQEKGSIDPGWTDNKDTTKIRRLDIVEHLRRANNVKGECSDFRIDDDQVTVSFKGPGYAADAFINRATGGYDLTVTTAGLVGVINDLHKGRDTGHGWSVFIDICAVFLTLVSLSGLLLLLFLKKRRLSGLLVAAGGLVIAWLIYKIWIK